jgi:bifunctional DNA-binding transcriptional regulator/antitoxin component of YhaV-PrlF toxin-antitoxin module
VPSAQNCGPGQDSRPFLLTPGSAGRSLPCQPQPGATIPKAMLERYRLAEGDRVHQVETEHGILITPFDPDFADAMAAYEESGIAPEEGAVVVLRAHDNSSQTRSEDRLVRRSTCDYAPITSLVNGLPGPTPRESALCR